MVSNYLWQENETVTNFLCSFVINGYRFFTLDRLDIPLESQTKNELRQCFDEGKLSYACDKI